MGWKGKFVFLLIIYFAGFATAVYNLAPDGRMDCKASEYNNYGQYSDDSDNAAVSDQSSAKFKDYCNKAVAATREKISNIDKQAMKEKFNRGVEKIKKMIKESRSADAEENTQNE